MTAFVDIETLGLHPDAPIWEFAILKDTGTGTTIESFFIQHEPGDWLDTLPEPFKQDYLTRYRHGEAENPSVAAAMIFGLTSGTVIAGVNPTFDVERLAGFLRAHGKTPQWYYSPIDLKSATAGFISAHVKLQGQVLQPPPWSSDALSRMVGVDPDQFERHTALGDVLWTKAMWDAVMLPNPEPEESVAETLEGQPETDTQDVPPVVEGEVINV